MSPNTPSAHPSPPVTGISETHNDIIAHLFDLVGLSTTAPLDAAASAIATRAIEFFDRTMRAHHQAEESHLFPAVLALAQDGTEREFIQAMVSQLTQEHRTIEALWAELSGLLRQLVAGTVPLATDAHIQRLVLDYGDHATREESELLPLCQIILRRGPANSHTDALLEMHRLKPA